MDLTEDIIDPVEQGVDLEGLNNTGIYGRGSMAFYVCNGARLMVMDGTKKEDHNRSLMQQGSVVVVHNGYLSIEVAVRRPITKNQETGRSHFIASRFYWTDAFNSVSGCFPSQLNERLADEEKPFDRAEEGGRQLSHWYRKVLFLGAIESQYNTAVWHLYLYATGHCHLQVADGCMLQDVAPWNTGWKLIRARHLFERSYESCFGPISPNQPSARLSFEAPTDPYIFMRMLGIQGNRILRFDCPQNLNLPQNYRTHNQEVVNDYSVRRQLDFNEKFAFDSHTDNTTEPIHIGAHTMRMAPPPLYPPILEEYTDGYNNTTKLVYSRKKFTIVELKENLEDVDVRDAYGNSYWVEKLPQLEYEWVKVDNVNAYYWRDEECHEDYRFGDDYCWYKKVGNANEFIGKTEVYCLRENPDEEEEEAAIGGSPPEVDQPQQVEPEEEEEAAAEESEVEEVAQTSSQKKKRNRQKKKNKKNQRGAKR